MNCKSVLRLCAVGLSLCFSAGGYGGSITVNGSNVTLLSGSNLTVTDLYNDGYWSTHGQSSAGMLEQFNSSLGVLTGATATLVVPTSTTSLTRSGVVGTAAVSVGWSLGGNTLGSVFNFINYTYNGTSDTSWDNTILTSSSVNLNNFVGVGNIASNSVSTAILARKEQSVTGNTVATVNKNLIGSQSIVYTYTAHSNASFLLGIDTNSLAFDYGQLNAGTSVDHGFSIFGLTGGLGLTGYTSSFLFGDDVFQVTGGNSVGAGASGIYNAHFSAQTPGIPTTYNGTYRITFTDDVSSLGGVFASNSVGTNFIDLSLTAAVSVPEPESWGLILAGLGLVGMAARRRKTSHAV